MYIKGMQVKILNIFLLKFILIFTSISGESYNNKSQNNQIDIEKVAVWVRISRTFQCLQHDEHGYIEPVLKMAEMVRWCTGIMLGPNWALTGPISNCGLDIEDSENPCPLDGRAQNELEQQWMEMRERRRQSRGESNKRKWVTLLTSPGAANENFTFEVLNYFPLAADAREYGQFTLLQLDASEKAPEIETFPRIAYHSNLVAKLFTQNSRFYVFAINNHISALKEWILRDMIYYKEENLICGIPEQIEILFSSTNKNTSSISAKPVKEFSPLFLFASENDNIMMLGIGLKSTSFARDANFCFLHFNGRSCAEMEKISENAIKCAELDEI